MARLSGFLILSALATIAVAQEGAAPPADDSTAAQSETTGESATAAETATEDSEPDLLDDPELDEQTYEEDEDVFVPTEEIPSDQPIPFPTNI